MYNFQKNEFLHTITKTKIKQMAFLKTLLNLPSIEDKQEV